jgi:Acetyltransferase (GNAT) domain
LRFFVALREIFGGDVDIWLASHQGRDLATIFTIGDGEKLYYKWAARDAGDLNGGRPSFVLVDHRAMRRALSVFDLGRSDQRKAGFNRFKHESSGRCQPLPYAFFPCAPESEQ